MVNTKLKPILPSLREKKRYLVFEVISRQKINDANAVAHAVYSCSQKFLGQLGAAKAGIMVLNNKWNANMQRGIVKAGHRHVDALKASLTFIDKVDNQDAIFKSLGVSGILKKAENNYLKY